MHLAFIAFQKLLWRQVGVVEFVSGQDETTVLVDEHLSGREREGQGAVNGVDHLVRWGSARGASPFAIAGPNVHRTRGEERGLQGVLEGSKRLTYIRFACTGGTAYFLPGFAFLVTLLAQLFIDGALGLGLAEFGVDQDPTLWHAAVNGGQLAIAIVLGERCHGLGGNVGQGGLGVA
jgi:hypothetical protein